MRLTSPPLALALALGLAPVAGAQEEERREVYYYPKIGSSEVFARTLAETPPANREVRVAFVTQVTKQQMGSPVHPRFAIFAKGAQAEELIVVGLDGETFKTLYRARAIMAQLSAPARATQFFVENDLSSVATFYDMLKILGFASLTISDGETWAHQVRFE